MSKLKVKCKCKKLLLSRSQLNARDAEIRAYYKAHPDITYKEMQNHFGMSDTVLHRIVNRSDDWKPSPRRDASLRTGMNKAMWDRREKMMGMYLDGMTLHAIGKVFNVTRQRIEQMLSRLPEYKAERSIGQNR